MSLTKATYSMIEGAPANVLDFGADNTGVLDSTAAFDAAEAYLATLGGGIMFVPPGDYRLNWVCATDNIIVQGSGGRGEFDDVCLRPFSILSPTVTIASGSANVYYCQLINLHISGSDGTVNGLTKYANNAPSALLLRGGAIRTIIDSCVLYNGKKTVSLEPSATNPVTGCRFLGCIIRNDITDSNLSRAIYTVRLADPGYNTDNKFTLTKLNKPGDGYAAEIDGTISGITFEVFQSYWDFKPAWGVLLKGSSGLVGDAWDLDPGVNGAIVIEADSDGDISRYISGLVRIGSQKFKFATYTVDIPVEASTFSYRQRINSPFIRGDAVFSDASDPYNTSVYLAHNSAGGYLQLSDADFTPRVNNAKSLGNATSRWSDVYGYKIRAGDGTAFWTTGTGSPEGAVTAPVGSIFTRLNGGANTTLYIKESGTGNTGWIAK